jgi:two-component system NtrC family sensor kinase
VGGDAPGRAAVGLPWLCPPAETLLALTDAAPDPRQLAADIATCALVARFARPSLTPTCRPFDPSILSQVGLPAAAATLLEQSHPLPHLPPAVHALAERAADTAFRLATEAADESPGMAAFCARLSFLGWAALSAVAPDAVRACLADPDHAADPTETERKRLGLDAAAVTRRLAARWRFPAWLTAVVGSLHLPPADAVRLGAPERLFTVVQQAVASSDPSSELVYSPADPAPPTPVSLHVRLLRVAAQARKSQAAAWVAAAEERIDTLTQVLGELRADFDSELRDAKLAGLAEFAAGAGHEINNPLAIISGNAQLLLAQTSTAEQQKALQTVVRQTRRIHDILQGTRHFARPPQPSPEPIDLAGWLPGVLGPLVAEAELKKQSLTAGMTGDRRLTVEADPAHLKQALGHLVQNALDAAPQGGWVRVGVEGHGRSVRITVDDNGPGPAADHVGHLFDPFFSGRSAGRGRGIGLSVAWRLAQINGGDVRYTPRPCGTTRFTLTVPRTAAAEQPDVLPLRKSA